LRGVREVLREIPTPHPHCNRGRFVKLAAGNLAAESAASGQVRASPPPAASRQVPAAPPAEHQSRLQIRTIHRWPAGPHPPGFGRVKGMPQHRPGIVPVPAGQVNDPAQDPSLPDPVTGPIAEVIYDSTRALDTCSQHS
jgi:hypothetical protein